MDYNNRQNSRRQQQYQVRPNTTDCQICRQIVPQRQFVQFLFIFPPSHQNEHQRTCQLKQMEQLRLQQQQQHRVNQRRQQQNGNQLIQQNRTRQQNQRDTVWDDFHQNFQWVNNIQNTQFKQQEADDSSDEEVEQIQQPSNFQCTFSYNGGTMPSNIQVQFDNIFGPNGVFTTTMNQVFQCSINSSNMHVNNQVFTNYQNSFQYEEDDDDDDDQQDEEEQETENPGLEPEEIQQIQTSTYRGDGSQSCVVCMNNFKRNEKLRVLICCHQFHRNCIDEWLLSKAQCPMCRMDLKHM